MFAKRLQGGKPRASDFCRRHRVFPAQELRWTEVARPWLIADLEAHRTG